MKSERKNTSDMSVTVGDHRSPEESEIDPDSLRQILEIVYRKLKLPEGDVEISLINDEQIKPLNRDYRKIDSPTNVLSFPHFRWDEPGVCKDFPSHSISENHPVLWGEVFVSCERVAFQAASGNVPFFCELIRICIHGILHLFGFDHITDDDYAVMDRKEKFAMEIASPYMECAEI